MERDQSSKREFLADEEFAKRAAPGGRLPVAGAKAAPGRGGDWTSIADGSPAAVAAKAEREHVRARPDLVAKRLAKGK